jgi:hypothetical protein
MTLSTPVYPIDSSGFAISESIEAPASSPPSTQDTPPAALMFLVLPVGIFQSNSTLSGNRTENCLLEQI